MSKETEQGPDSQAKKPDQDDLSRLVRKPQLDTKTGSTYLRLVLGGQIRTKRSAISRLFASLEDALHQAIGGADKATVGQLSACRRAAALACVCEQLEIELLEGGDFDRSEYLRVTRELRSQLAVLGVDGIAPVTLATPVPDAQPEPDAGQQYAEAVRAADRAYRNSEREES